MLAVVVVGAFAISSAQATQSPLDTSFGSGGKVTTMLSSTIDIARAVAVQPDGKIVAVGSGSNDSEIALVRYNPNGSLDASFGSGGKVTTSIPLGRCAASAVALQPDGKIVVAGDSVTAGSPTQRDFTLARYNANGSLDPTFGTNGLVTTDVLGHNDAATAVALQPDGKIVAAGEARTSSTWNFAAVRYNANGSIDTSFGTNGKVTTSLGSGDSVANALVRQPDGRLVLAGYTGSATSSEFALVRYTAGGSLDTSFGSAGKLTTALAGASQNVADAVTLQPDGKIVAAGVTDADAGLVRYDTNGSIDASFGLNGIAIGPIGADHAVTVQPDGNILAAGEAFNEDRSNLVFSLSRYAPDGSDDDTFGPDGAGDVTTGFGSEDDSALAIALQPDGKIVTAGFTANGSKYQFALARYLGATLVVTTSGNGIGTVSSSPAGIHCGPSCAASFADVPVTLTAKASARSAFAGWSGDCSGKGRCTLTMSTDHTLVAKFTAACVVPNVKGKTLQAAKRAIKRAHCSVGKIGHARSAKAKRGRVIGQKPRPWKKLPAHSRVRLTVSKGQR